MIRLHNVIINPAHISFIHHDKKAKTAKIYCTSRPIIEIDTPETYDEFFRKFDQHFPPEDYTFRGGKVLPPVN